LSGIADLLFVAAFLTIVSPNALDTGLMALPVGEWGGAAYRHSIILNTAVAKPIPKAAIGQ
jgi:hypothetical protein